MDIITSIMGHVLSLYAIHHFASETNDVLRLQKVITQKNYDNAAETGVIMLEEIDSFTTDKSFRCTIPDQTFDEINKYFSDRKYVVLELDVDKLKKNGFEVQMDVESIGGDTYPYLYHSSGRRQTITFECIKHVFEP